MELAARLKALGVSTLIVEKSGRVGDRVRTLRRANLYRGLTVP